MTDKTALPRWPAYLGWLPRFLFDIDTVPERYIGKAWLTVFLPGLALSALVALTTPRSSRHSVEVDGLTEVWHLVLLAPMLETLLMIVPLLVLNRLFGPGPAAVGSALLWGLAHSLSAPAWGLVAWWPFLIMSIAFLTWRRASLGMACLVVFAIHTLQNGLLTFILLMID